MKIELESRGKIMTDRERKLDELTDLLHKRGYLTKEEDELYGKLIDEELDEMSMSDEEELEFLKSQKDSPLFHPMVDFPGISTKPHKIPTLSELRADTDNRIAELEERIAKKNAINN